MLWRGVGICPLVGSGDIVGHDVWNGRMIKNYVNKEVIGLDYYKDRRSGSACTGTCRAFKCVALVRFSGNQHENPANLREVDCDLCPVLKEDPDYKKHSPTYEELRVLNSDEDFVVFGDEEELPPAPQMEETVSEAKETDRFDLIDISDEKE